MSSKNIKKKSFISELKQEGRINENFVITVSNLTIEELILIKLESSVKLAKGKLYGMPLWYNLPHMVKDALMEFVIRNCRSKLDMCSTLGISYELFIENYKLFIDNKEEE